MMKIINWQTLTTSEQQKILARPQLHNADDILTKVKNIISNVRTKGDEALKEYTALYDHVALDSVEVRANEWEVADKIVLREIKTALEQAASQLQQFYQPQLPKQITVESIPGVVLTQEIRPLAKVGLYIPGGTAPLLSTVLMLGIPAKIANCPLRILCTPPRKDGNIDASILWAAQLCGIRQVFKVGGAQAIAAMAFGTKTIPKVDKIFGPGNTWVTAAKMLVAEDPNGAAIDLPAGPSEVMIIADNSANPKFIAADLLSQAEHGEDSQVILICDDNNLVEMVNNELEQQLSTLPRKAIASKALVNSAIIIVSDLSQAITIVNDYAPEHLLLQTKNPRTLLADIQTAGSIFIGNYSPEAAGDYASGTNHVLPTYGYARSYSGLSVTDFVKHMSVQELTREGLLQLSSSITTLASAEGLIGHRRAIEVRLAEILAKTTEETA